MSEHQSQRLSYPSWTRFDGWEFSTIGVVDGRLGICIDDRKGYSTTIWLPLKFAHHVGRHLSHVAGGEIILAHEIKEGSDVARESDEPASHDDSPQAVAPSTSALETTGGDP